MTAVSSERILESFKLKHALSDAIVTLHLTNYRPFCLIAGLSGSGKTNGALYLLKSMVKKPKSVIWISRCVDDMADKHSDLIDYHYDELKVKNIPKHSLVVFDEVEPVNSALEYLFNERLCTVIFTHQNIPSQAMTSHLAFTLFGKGQFKKWMDNDDKDRANQKYIEEIVSVNLSEISSPYNMTAVTEMGAQVVPLKVGLVAPFTKQNHPNVP